MASRRRHGASYARISPPAAAVPASGGQRGEFGAGRAGAASAIQTRSRSARACLPITGRGEAADVGVHAAIAARDVVVQLRAGVTA